MRKMLFGEFENDSVRLGVVVINMLAVLFVSMGVAVIGYVAYTFCLNT